MAAAVVILQEEDSLVAADFQVAVVHLEVEELLADGKHTLHIIFHSACVKPCI
jgi:hypothetical protein